MPHNTHWTQVVPIIYLNLTRLRPRGDQGPPQSLHACTRCTTHICNTHYFTFCMAHEHLQTVVFQLPSLLPLSCHCFSHDAKLFLILSFLFTCISPSTTWFQQDVCWIRTGYLFLATHAAAAAIADTLQASQLPVFEEHTGHHLPEFFPWPVAAK